MTLADLSEAWNELRTITLGRNGMEPKVSAQLARDLADAYGRWRQWYTDAGPLDDALGSLSAQHQITMYRRLEARARGEGLHVPELLPETTAEFIPRAASEGAAKLAMGVAALGVLALGVGLVGTRSRRG